MLKYFPLLVIALILSACSSDDDGPGPRPPGAKPTGAPSVSPLRKASSTSPGCLPVPVRQPIEFTWLPEDLELPRGTFAVQEVRRSEVTQFSSGILAVPLSLDDFVRFVQTAWTRSGYFVAKRDEEPGEMDLLISAETLTGGVRVRRAYCDSGWSEVFLSLGRT